MERQLICFIVVGRMGKSLTCSKAEPFARHPSIDRIYIFREAEGFPLPKSTYITLPSWITGLRPRWLSRIARSIAEPLQLIYCALKYRPDFINGYHIIPKGLNSLIAARMTGSRCIISLIGGIVEIDTYSRIKWLLKRLNLWALKKSDLITTKGTVVNAYLTSHKILSSKVLVYNGGINLEKFYYNPTVLKDIDVLFIGTFRNLKGPDRVLQILALLKNNFPEIKACFLGDGYLYQSCIDMASTLNISKNVSFEGHIEDPSIYFQRSKILVLPSRSEGLPTSILEAMSCGCVPVVSNVGNICDAAIHSQNAFLINDYQDFDSFAKHIERLLLDEDLRLEMAKSGVTTVVNKYSVVQQMRVVSNIIQKLFKGYGDI